MARRRSYGRRNNRRGKTSKFVWARTSGQVTTQAGQLNSFGVDLLAQFQQEYGAQLLGATFVRARGLMFPRAPGISAAAQFGGIAAMIVEQDQILNDEAQRIAYQPGNRRHDDWLAWMPFFQVGGATPGRPATSFNGSSDYNVDIKSSRKIEELGQGLHLWMGHDPNLGGNPEQEIDLYYSLSLGLKLP